MKSVVLDIMRFRVSKYLLLFLLLSVGFNGFSQTKQEREFRIEKSELPEAVIFFIDDLPNNSKRLRFYKEVDGEKQSFEVKFRIKKIYYSAEFDTNGKIEDIEVLTKTRQINETILNTVETYFENNFKKAKFLKVQKQFLPIKNTSPNNLLRSILSGELDTQAHFEIIAEITENSTCNLREFNFDQNGNLISSRVVAPSSYGHVLY